MKCQDLFLLEIKKKKSELSSALVVIGSLRVNMIEAKADATKSFDICLFFYMKMYALSEPLKELFS